MADTRVEHIDEQFVAGKPLGRHVHHDPRSRGFDVAEVLDTTAPLASVLHTRLVAPYDQGNLGSCTGNAMAGALMTDPLHRPGVQLDEHDAVGLYSAATKVDRVRGVYPPDDTGSTGLAVAKAARARGFISAYRHAFSFTSAMHALMAGPVIAGVNWYDSFDHPGAGGRVTLAPSAQVRGGHEVCLVGLSVERRTVRACNSWGVSWGDGGFFEWGWDDFERLLAEHGDVTVPVR